MRKLAYLAVILGLVFLISGCGGKKAIKSEQTSGQIQEETGSLPSEVKTSEDLTEGQILPEESARGKVFSGVMHIDLEDVHFDFDQAILNSEARNSLSKNVEILKNNPDVLVQIEGHCDERGTVEYNLALGQKRATAVRNYLVEAGVDSKRIFTISYGKEKPVDAGHTEEAWEKNRRAHPAVATQ